MNVHTPKRGFTLIELLVVIAIMGVLLAVVSMAISDSRTKGRDGARKTQIQEVIKGLELFYSDGGTYPLDGTPADGTIGGTLTTIGSGFIGGRYLSRLPDESDRYQYCVTGDQKSILIAINTENDKGGSNYCSIIRGPGPTYGCDAWRTANASDLCAARF